jgi:hypothetical protein
VAGLDSGSSTTNRGCVYRGCKSTVVPVFYGCETWSLVVKGRTLTGDSTKGCRGEKIWTKKSNRRVEKTA